MKMHRVLAATIAAVAMAAPGAASAADTDWFEIPSGARFEDSFSFYQLERLSQAEGKVRVPALYVRRGSYAEGSVIVDCAARTADTPQVPMRLRGSNEDGGTLGGGQPISFAGAGSYEALGNWLCGGRDPAGLAAFSRVPGDPKPGAWQRIDALTDGLPSALNGMLGRVAPSLTLSLDGQSFGVTSAQVAGCQMILGLSNGRRARLDLLLNNPVRRTRALYFDSVRITGFSEEDFELLDYALKWMPAPAC